MGITYYTDFKDENQQLIVDNCKKLDRETSRKVKMFLRLKAKGSSNEEVASKLKLNIDEVENLEVLSLIKKGSDYSHKHQISERDQFLIIELARRGLELYIIAQIIGCTTGEAKFAARKYYLTYESKRDPFVEEPTKEDWRAVECLAFSGKDVEFIAQRIHCTRKQTRMMMNKIFDSYQSQRPKNKPLWLDDRIVLEYQYKRGHSQRSIAQQLNCSPQTICNQLKPFPQGYDAFESYNLEKQRKQQKRGPYKLEQCQEFIDACCQECNNKNHSPDSFCQDARLNPDSEYYNMEKVCTNTIYNYIRNGYISIDLFRGLKKSTKKFTPDPKEHKDEINGKSIEELPNTTAEDGQSAPFRWEIDTVVGKREAGKVLLTLRDTRTHYGVAVLLLDKTAASVNEALEKILEQAGELGPDLFKWVIADNGKEFVHINDIPELKGQTYFAHPATPTDKPFVERYNEQIRQFCPKGQSMNHLTQEDVLSIMHKINNRPVRSLDWATPEEVMLVEIKKLMESHPDSVPVSIGALQLQSLS